MPFSPPTFNIEVGIWDGPNVPIGLPRLSVMANLAHGARVSQIIGAPNDFAPQVVGTGPQLMLPALTDIRDLSQGSYQDIVEAPLLSGRFYLVTHVDDVGKGFANEYRLAFLIKIYDAAGAPGDWSGSGVFWPIPMT